MDETRRMDPDPVLLRGLTQRRLSRRSLFRYAGAGIAGLSLPALLAACGEETSAPSGAGPTQAAGFDWASQVQTGTFTFANWPFYIDKERVDGKVTYPSLERFTDETGIQVNYNETINDYASFFAKIRPILEADDDTGFDLMVMGYPRWLPLMIQLDYLTPLDQSRLENFRANSAPKYQDPSYDPGNTFTIAYQSGITGIGYNPELTGREITSLNDLFDPAFEGRVGMFGDTEDLPNLTLLSAGVEPSDSTEEDWRAAATKLQEQRDAGIVRQYFGQGYIGALQAGDVALTMAWSADVLQSQLSGFPELQFVVPDEGGLLWTDSLSIVKGAQHPLDAMIFMDYLYRPEIAALLTGWIQNVSPVPESQQILSDEGLADVADNPLVFPTDDMYERLHGYRILTPAEQEVWDDMFLAIVES